MSLDMFSRCAAKLNLVFLELMTEVGKEWAISLHSYLWQVHTSDRNKQVKKTQSRNSTTSYHNVKHTGVDLPQWDSQLVILIAT